jgi:hypothetical protein
MQEEFAARIPWPDPGFLVVSDGPLGRVAGPPLRPETAREEASISGRMFRRLFDRFWDRGHNVFIGEDSSGQFAWRIKEFRRHLSSDQLFRGIINLRGRIT